MRCLFWPLANGAGTPEQRSFFIFQLATIIVLMEHPPLWDGNKPSGTTACKRAIAWIIQGWCPVNRIPGLGASAHSLRHGQVWPSPPVLRDTSDDKRTWWCWLTCMSPYDCVIRLLKVGPAVMLSFCFVFFLCCKILLSPVLKRSYCACTNFNNSLCAHKSHNTVEQNNRSHPAHLKK